MKLKLVLRKLDLEQEIECESFEFDNGFLKINKPSGKGSPEELYISMGDIGMISSFGKQLKKKTTKK